MFFWSVNFKFTSWSIIPWFDVHNCLILLAIYVLQIFNDSHNTSFIYLRCSLWLKLVWISTGVTKVHYLDHSPFAGTDSIQWIQIIRLLIECVFKSKYIWKTINGYSHLLKAMNSNFILQIFRSSCSYYLIFRRL